MIFRSLFLVIAGGALASCGTNNSDSIISKAVPHSSGSHINNKVKFSSAAYGVAASPRVTTSREVRKGGGRRQIGKPYKIKGKWYHPREEPGYDRVGQASWYGPNFHGRLTANGEVYDQFALSAAHPTFPLPSYARVTNKANGRSVIVRVNDRGPYHAKRIIDLSARASELLGYQHKGIANVRVQYLKQAPLHGRDAKFLEASYRDGGNRLYVKNNGSPSGQFDHTLTGSVKKNVKTKKVDVKEAKGPDSFLADLSAINRSKDTGSTMALRLRDQFIVKDQRY